jgi:alkanesulfonate monooxygenase
MNNDLIHFHWRLLESGDTDKGINVWQNNEGKSAMPNLELQSNFCNTAEQLGISAVLVDISYAKPDPILLTTALLHTTNTLGFIIAVRSGLLSPTLFTQQINTLSTFSNQQIYLNIVAGYSPNELKTYGDFLDHDQRYERTAEFLDICTQFWSNNGTVNLDGNHLKVTHGKLNTHYVSEFSKRPFIFIAGGSQPAIDLTLKYGDCLMQLGDTLQNIKSKIQPILAKGKAAGLRFSIIARATNQEAIAVASQLQTESMQYWETQNQQVQESDSESIQTNYKQTNQEWLSENLWTGAVKTIGPAAIALVGSYEEVATRIFEYKQIGVTHFILSGWPKQEEMRCFAKNVLPLIRKMEMVSGKQDRLSPNWI